MGNLLSVLENENLSKDIMKFSLKLVAMENEE